MAEYGLTPEGVNIKRLDVILDELHEDLSEGWGVNTRKNPQSFVNTLLTDFADKIAELWELGLDVYNSQYPMTAEGLYLDGVGQFTGVTRDVAAPSYYSILCTGTDGTEIPKSTIISSNTAPAIYFRPTKVNTISRDDFNKAKIKILAVDGNPLTVALNGNVYSATPEKGTATAAAAQMLVESINDPDFVESYEDDTEYINIEAVNETSQNVLVLSDNLTTALVGSVFTFRTEDEGDIYLPEGSINEITKAVTGLSEVTNVGNYIAGREQATDTEYRQSYEDKIFLRSSRMVDSIRSAILSNVQGVSAVAVYENDSDYTDDWGRYPHSVEVVCDGGDETEIAQQILNTKAGGISTYGDQVVVLQGDYDEDLTIRFNRPEYLNLWIHVEVSEAPNGILPTNYSELIRDIIVQKVSELTCGDDVMPQYLFVPEIYAQVNGVGFVRVLMEVGDEKPDEYTQHNIYATVRERAVTSEEMIEVIISG